MFAALQALWKQTSVMRDAVDRIVRMVADSQTIFSLAWQAAITAAAQPDAHARIRECDKAVNRGEREIRRLIIEHLAMNPGQDAAGCLALLIMAKDVERVGDHARDIAAVAADYAEPITGLPCYADLDDLHARIAPLFPKLQDAIRNSDEKAAHEILAGYQEIKPIARDLQHRLYTLTMPCRQAVAATLLSRCLLRVNAHIGNATSGVIFPLEDIDFVSRGLRREGHV